MKHIVKVRDSKSNGLFMLQKDIHEKTTWLYEMQREIYCNGKDYWMKMSCQKPCAGILVSTSTKKYSCQQCNMDESAIWTKSAICPTVQYE